MYGSNEVEAFISDIKSDATDHKKQLPPGTSPFITISSQSGAGGNLLARQLLDNFDRAGTDHPTLKGWRIFDRGMCQRLLEDEHLANSMNELLAEEYHSQITEFVLGIFGNHGMQNVAYARLSRFMRTIATVGKVIITGYGGCMATHQLAGGNHLRLVAPLPLRAARMAPVLQLNETQALRELQKRDSDTRQLLKTHYRVDSTDPEHYDLVCNTERLTIESIAAIQQSIILAQTRPETLAMS